MPNSQEQASRLTLPTLDIIPPVNFELTALETLN